MSVHLLKPAAQETAPEETQVNVRLYACQRGHVHLLRDGDELAVAQVVAMWDDRPDVVEATRDDAGQLAFCPIPIRELYQCEQGHVHVRHSNGAGTFEDFWPRAQVPAWLKWSEDQVCRDDAGRFASCGGDGGGGSGRTREGRQREQQARLEHAHSLVKGILTGDRPVPTDKLKELHDHLGKLTVAQLQQVRQHYGLKAPGRLKDQLKNGIASRLAGMAGSQPRPEAKVESGTFGTPKNLTWIGDEAEHKRLAEMILGPGSTREQLAACAGVVDGSHVRISDASNTGVNQAVRVAFNGRTAEGDYNGSRRLTLDSDGTKRIYNAVFEGKGAGLPMFAREVENATLHGFSEIKTHAAGYGSAYDHQYGQPSDYNGYYTWPRFGYNQQMESHQVARVPPELRPQLEAAGGYISGLMSTKEGRDWWQKNGSDLDSMKFDLTPGSYSQRTLTAYLKERGLTKAGPWGTHAIIDPEGCPVADVKPCSKGHLHVRLVGGQSWYIYPASAPPAWLKWSEDQVCRDDHGRFASCGGGSNSGDSGGRTGHTPGERERRAQEKIDRAHELINLMMDGPKPIPHDKVKELTEHLGSMTVAHLHTIKEHYGLKASGKNKEALRDRLVTRFVDKIHEELGDYNPLSDRPEEWSTAEEGKEWGQEKYRSWVSTLTNDEKEAVQNYKEDHYEPINKGLRNGDSPTSMSAPYATTIAHLDTALAAAKTSKDVIVYRGARRSTADKILAAVGGVFEDRAFQSTSVDKQVARDFANMAVGDMTRLVMSIHVPKNSRGAYVDAVPDVENSHEGEFLMPRGTRLHILSAERGPFRVWHVKARVAS